jgi:hypothetical protein
MGAIRPAQDDGGLSIIFCPMAQALRRQPFGQAGSTFPEYAFRRCRILKATNQFTRTQTCGRPIGRLFQLGAHESTVNAKPIIPVICRGLAGWRSCAKRTARSLTAAQRNNGWL